MVRALDGRVDRGGAPMTAQLEAGERLMADLHRAVAQSFPALDEDAQRVSLAIYRTLARGRPVDLDALAEAPGLPPAEVVRSLVEGWPAVYRDESGAVIGYWGLALGGTGHRVEVEGVELTTWCAWDALFLPSILAAEVLVDSPCPVSGERIRLRLSPAGILDARPGRPVLSFLDPTGKIGDGVISSFCHHIHFFVDRAAADGWAAVRPDALILSLEQGWRLAEALNLARYSRLRG